MTVRNVVDVENKERREKRLVGGLFAFCIAGFSLIFYHYIDVINRPSLPEDLAQVEQTIEDWHTSGLIERFDAPKARLVVNDDRWKSMRKEQKLGIVTQLARFCADASKKESWKLQVIESKSLAVVGELGDKGLVLQ
jgi:hypothetical protein